MAYWAMIPGNSRILKVPYFAQPTGTTCQGTVLMMFAKYLDQKLARCSIGGTLNPEQIKTEVNTAPGRPSKLHNSHENFRWWLEHNFAPLKADKFSTAMAHEATEWIVRKIDAGFPVICSVTHANNDSGHIVLAIGYENFRPNMSSLDFQLVVHDPYGAYHPALKSTLYGQKRYTSGQSLLGGGEKGPGSSIRIPINAASREHKAGHSFGQWLLSSVRH